MFALIGKKLGHTRIITEAGEMVPVTVIKVGPNWIAQKRTQEVDRYNAVQLGFEELEDKKLTRALRGHFAKNGAKPARVLREFRDFPIDAASGTELGASLFEIGDFVDIIGTTKGRGFEGVVKRYNFRGGDATHGAKGWHRRTGAIGQRLFPGTVMKGQKMPGHMGAVRRTVQNLRVVGVVAEENILLVRGSAPGAEGDYVVVRQAKKKTAPDFAKRFEKLGAA